MKPILPVLAALLAATPALAQNAAQIDHARRGASCPRCNLFQADFGGAELKGRNFAGARLRQANLSVSVMNHTNFSGADLRDADASAAVFSSSNFAGADLTNATFVGTYLQGANFHGARMNGTNFSGAEMDHAVGLTQGQLNGACGEGDSHVPRGLRLQPCR